MMNAIYNKVKRAAALALAAALAVPATPQAQEALHLFYKNGNLETIEMTPDTKVEFVKQPYLDETNYTAGGDTIHLSASAGRSWSYGYVRSNVPWTVSVDADWLTVRRTKLDVQRYPVGDGMVDEPILIFAEGNTTGHERAARLTIGTTKGVSKVITVVQHPYLLSLDPTGEYWGNEATTTMTDTVAWSNTVYYAYAYPNHSVALAAYPEWMTLDTLADGAGDFTLDKVAAVPDSIGVTWEYITNQSTTALFRMAANESPADRTGEIVFEGNGQKAVITVTQKGLTEEGVASEAAELMDGFYHNGAAYSWGTYHSDFGFPALMFSMDCRGTDLVSEDVGYNHFGSMQMYADLSSTAHITASRWTSMYNHILTANRGIESYSGREGESLFQFYLGQAYTLRAFNYFYLAQLYQQTYVGNEEQPCVPIVTESAMHTIYAEGRVRATVREVYDFILSDLDKALHLLQQTAVKRPAKQFVTPEVVYGLRARIYMVMNRWEEAAADAQRVIDAGVAAPYTREEVSRPTFDNINHDAWLWGIDTEETDNPVATGIINWPSHMGSLNYGYAQVGVWRMVNQSLYNAIPTTDVRKGWFLDANCTSANLNAEQANYAKSYGMYPYTQVKFAPYNDVLGTMTNANDIPLMRIEEMHLILAEAKAMTGDVAGGAAVLNSFVSSYRDAAYNCTAATAGELVEAVWMQRRIELWGEGHSYFDLMRMKKGVDRRGAGFQSSYVYNIPAGDAALIYPIPEREMNDNALLIQNPEAEQPMPVEDSDEWLGTGTYTYSVMFSEPVADAGLNFYKELSAENTYRIENWFSGVDFTFTWDGGSAVRVSHQPTGYVYGTLGEIYVMELSDIAGEEMAPSYYDAETKTFYFGVIYFVSEGYLLGMGYETFTLDGSQAAAVSELRTGSPAVSGRAFKKVDTSRMLTKRLDKAVVVE